MDCDIKIILLKAGQNSVLKAKKENSTLATTDDNRQRQPATAMMTATATATRLSNKNANQNKETSVRVEQTSEPKRKEQNRAPNRAPTTQRKSIPRQCPSIHLFWEAGEAQQQPQPYGFPTTPVSPRYIPQVFHSLLSHFQREA